MIREKLVPVAWLMAVAVLVGSQIGLAARAGADPVDDQAYIKTLDDFNVPYPSPADAIAWGHEICAAFDEGASFVQVVSNVVVNADFRPTEAGHLIGASIGIYCPEWDVLLKPGRRLA